MPKSQIIIEAINEDVPLEKSLRRLEALAHDVHNEELEKWAEHELSGYRGIEVPDYRKSTSIQFVYNGINGRMQVTNVPLPLGLLKNETVKTVANIQIREGIRTIKDFAASESGVQIDLTSLLAPEVEEKTYGMVQCVSVHQMIAPSIPNSILDEVSSRVIKAFMMLEETYGNLDKLGITVKPFKAIQSNSAINDALGLPVVVSQSEPLRAKIAWNLVVPIITVVAGSLLTAVLLGVLQLS